MPFQDELNIERFKSIIDRQKYFTELARDTFNLYIKAFIYIITGAIALISLREKFTIPVNILHRLVNILLLLIYIIAIASTAQIIFCLVRWYKLKDDEMTINSNAKKEWWAWIYEGIYIVTILISILIVFLNRGEVDEIIKLINQAKK